VGCRFLGCRVIGCGVPYLGGVVCLLVVVVWFVKVNSRGILAALLYSTVYMGGGGESVVFTVDFLII
jgi:hypothetical protein